MKASKWLTIITIVLTMISLLMTVLFYFHNIQLAYDIALAIFGGAILGAIMSLIEYYAAKRQSMEVFYLEALKAVADLNKAKYLFTDEPINLVVNCIAEEWSNKWSKSAGKPLKQESKIKLIEYYKQGIPVELIDSPEFIKCAENWYSSRMEAYYNELEKCMDSYIQIANIQLGDLDNAYGSLDFIIANKTLRKMAYEQVYAPIKELRKSALRQAYHFQLYKTGEGNISHCTAFLLKLNEEWFSKKEINNEDVHSITIYLKCSDILTDEIEKFRCKIYKQKYEAEEHHPIMSKIYRINHKE